MHKYLFPLILFAAVIPRPIFAHCPLCTAGAGAAAAGAAILGVKHEVIGLLIGAFAAALGFYLANRIKKRYFPGQKQAVVAATFLLTVLPLVPLLEGYYGLNVSIAGEYGSLLNRVYLVDRFLVGTIGGGILMFFMPSISGWVTKLRKDKRFPYQSLIITFLTLALAALTLQLAA